jgi:uncharacterized protein YbcI
VSSEPRPTDSITTTISRGNVHLLKEFYGRGPVSTRMRERFVAMVEETTGREVVSFMSANDQEADAMAELFLLRPQAA